MNSDHHKLGAKLSCQKINMDNNKVSKHVHLNQIQQQTVSTNSDTSTSGIIEYKYNLALRFNSKRDELIH